MWRNKNCKRKDYILGKINFGPLKKTLFYFFHDYILLQMDKQKWQLIP